MAQAEQARRTTCSTFAENAAREAVAHRDAAIARVRAGARAPRGRRRRAHRQGRPASRTPSASSTCCDGALRKAFVRDGLTVVCNPDDLDACIDAGPDAARDAVGTCSDLEFIGDRRVQRGGVVVRTDAGDIDATLDSQLERLCEAMLARRRCLTATATAAWRSTRSGCSAPTRTALNGRVIEVIGLVVESAGPRGGGGGDLPHRRPRAAPRLRAEVVGFRDGRTLLMPLGDDARHPARATRSSRPGAAWRCRSAPACSAA